MKTCFFDLALAHGDNPVIALMDGIMVWKASTLLVIQRDTRFGTKKRTVKALWVHGSDRSKISQLRAENIPDLIFMNTRCHGMFTTFLVQRERHG